MHLYRIDLHIHTCLSPCGSLEMSPSAIVEIALERGLDAIAVTDHNTTLQCPEIQAIGEERGLKVFAGVEVTTREEAHCVVLFETDSARAAFQEYLDVHLPPLPNDPERFGDQVWVNRENEILGEAPYLLLSALDQSVNQIAAQAKKAGDLFLAAHIERPSFSLISQLGFIDPALPLDAIEYHDRARFEKLLHQYPYLSKYTAYSASDAHYPDQIGTRPSLWQTEATTFGQLKNAFQGNHPDSFFCPSEKETDEQNKRQQNKGEQNKKGTG